MSTVERPSLLSTAVESVVGNRLGAGVYRRWVDSLGLEGDERVLEVGTGAGACARHLAPALRAGSLTCLDIDGGWLSIARSRLEPWEDRVEFVEADISAWIRPGFADIAVVHFVLHDIPAERRPAAVANIAGSLRGGGRVALREPTGHGAALSEMTHLLKEAGLEPVAPIVPSRVPLMGECLTGSWILRR